MQIYNSAPFIDHSTIRHTASRGVYISGGSPKLSYNTIISNTASGAKNGGGVLISRGSATLTRNNISGNLAGGKWGGGVAIEVPDTFTLTHNIIIGNSATNGGGGIYLHHTGDGAVTISDNIVVGNSVAASSGYGGGGVFVDLVYSAPVTLIRNVIAENSAAVENAGGILIKAGAGSNANATVEYNSLVRNTAENDAAGHWEYVEGSFSNNTLVDNVVTGSDNQLQAVYIKGYPLFNDNNIFRNNGYALNNGNQVGDPSLDATDNWWGSTNEAAIQTLIYDGNDSVSRSVVDYSPYRATHNTEAPISPPINVFMDEARTKLIWSPNAESDLDGYIVYWDTDSGYPYANSAKLANVNHYDITGLPPGTYFAVTAYDTDATVVESFDNQTNGNESWYSQEAEVRWWVYLPLVLNGF